MRVYKQQIQLNLLVEGVREINAACITRAWLGPFSAHAAGLAYFGDQLKCFLVDSNSLQESAHGVL